MRRFIASNSKFKHICCCLVAGLICIPSAVLLASESEALSDEIEAQPKTTTKPELHALPSPKMPKVQEVPAEEVQKENPIIETELPATEPMTEKLELPAPTLDRSEEDTKILQDSQPTDEVSVESSDLEEIPSTTETTEEVVTEHAESPKKDVAEEKKQEQALEKQASSDEVTEATADSDNTETVTPEIAQETPAEPEAPKSRSITLLGTEIPPGLATRVAWRPGHALKGLASQAPVLVVNGAEAGPTLCITGAVHGDELNGIEIVRQVLHSVKASKLKGTLIGVPIVNIQGFLRSSRYLVDRRDLNRFFPGTQHGSLASRIAYSFFHQVITNCSALVDVHTGSFYRDNIPQLRADLKVPSVVEMTEGFGSTLVLQSSGAEGTLRKAAVKNGIPAVTLELGGPMILDATAVEHGVEGILNLMDSLGMYKKLSFWGTPKPVYYESLWVRAEHGGIFFSKVKLGDKIEPGDLLGTITNPITNEQYLLTSPFKGEVVGLANNQVVYPGFATVHLAFKTKAPQNNEQEVSETLELN